MSVLKPLDLKSTPPLGSRPPPGPTKAHGCVLGVYTSCVEFFNFLVFSYQ